VCGERIDREEMQGIKDAMQERTGENRMSGMMGMMIEGGRGGTVMEGGSGGEAKGREGKKNTECRQRDEDAARVFSCWPVTWPWLVRDRVGLQQNIHTMDK